MSKVNVGVYRGCMGLNRGIMGLGEDSPNYGESHEKEDGT